MKHSSIPIIARAKIKHNIHHLAPDFLKLHHHVKKHGLMHNEEHVFAQHFSHDAKKYHKTFKKLSTHQIDSIKAYKGPDYTAINAYKRKGEETHQHAKQWADHLDSAISKFKSRTNIVGIRGIAARPEWIKENAVKGAVITDKGFMSVSTRPATVANYATAKKIQDSNRQSVIMKVNIPKGTHVLPLSPKAINDTNNAHKESENEYLMHSNSKWLVKSVKHAKIGGNRVTVLNVDYIKGDN